MPADCEFLEKCPMFRYFRASAKKVYQEMYCQGDFSRCERRKLRLAGRTVPDNLLPFGGWLWDDDAQPPDQWKK